MSMFQRLKSAARQWVRSASEPSCGHHMPMPKPRALWRRAVSAQNRSCFPARINSPFHAVAGGFPAFDRTIAVATFPKVVNDPAPPVMRYEPVIRMPTRTATWRIPAIKSD